MLTANFAESFLVAVTKGLTVAVGAMLNLAQTKLNDNNATLRQLLLARGACALFSAAKYGHLDCFRLLWQAAKQVDDGAILQQMVHENMRCNRLSTIAKALRDVPDLLVKLLMTATNLAARSVVLTSVQRELDLVKRGQLADLLQSVIVASQIPVVKDTIVSQYRIYEGRFSLRAIRIALDGTSQQQLQHLVNLVNCGDDDRGAAMGVLATIAESVVVEVRDQRRLRI